MIEAVGISGASKTRQQGRTVEIFHKTFSGAVGAARGTRTQVGGGEETKYKIGK